MEGLLHLDLPPAVDVSRSRKYAVGKRLPSLELMSVSRGARSTLNIHVIL